ncbi:MAG: phosphoglycerate kinase [Gammaproteobacteria bacterium]|nr:phosphoglycerate kinase [Gammaproteobacteria bacterium]MXW46259.1 phosphoglycerate kinase [Gammaproteobacteria bacterium]MYD00902.1 phosphoglycerate kinase [Gammaproteobacteria bacterium]MYI24996.1 phosphoglycerate kinase [Gammaproteobacteria bacterium]
MELPALSSAVVTGRRVMIRADLNVPIEKGRVANDQRIRAALPAIRHCLDRDAAVIVLSHLGRPAEGSFDARYSLAPVAEALSRALGRPVPLRRDWLDGVDVSGGQAVLCENVRFNAGEKDNSPELGKRMAALCDLFVMDAFGSAHRAQASVHAVARAAPEACAGPLLLAELRALQAAFSDPPRPLTAIAGGAKISGKLGVLRSLVSRADALIPGGGIANTLLGAAGVELGASLAEPEMFTDARQVLSGRAEVLLPVDAVLAPSPDTPGHARIAPVEDVRPEEMILDIGPRTAALYAKAIADAGAVVWNGPLGLFEVEAFAGGTRKVAEAVAASPAFRVAGGGDTLRALDEFGLASELDHLCTGGGAMLAWLEGRELPGISVLQTR